MARSQRYDHAWFFDQHAEDGTNALDREELPRAKAEVDNKSLPIAVSPLAGMDDCAVHRTNNRSSDCCISHENVAATPSLDDRFEDLTQRCSVLWSVMEAGARHGICRMGVHHA
ncbi:hypothetical protein DOTSEDRAFT_31705 [Dothistroma septosporum NZE10]|uniref:Uncharacterized protein n=1 Tax=Dothistroma septosporum (strain NZE10 / CBS 128990) TaxID=675120 RepID=N1PUS1_DOTSN|nr:hypothetical protein DOTSEDRAFT_31705 [Dothistroma septosporum NZE10]